MTAVFLAVLFLSFGLFLGAELAIRGLRRQADDLDQERLRLDLDRRNLTAAQRELFRSAVRQVVRDNPPVQAAHPAARKAWLS